MRIIKLLVLPVLLLLLLGACQVEQTPTGGSEPTATTAINLAPTPTPIPQAVIQTPSTTTDPEAIPEEVNECLICHADMQKLIDTAKSAERVVNANLGLGVATGLPAMEGWEKVLVDGEVFPGTVHGLIGCSGCHGGQQSPEKDVAHSGLLVDPSADAGGVCSQCHPHITAAAENSMHNNLTGYYTILERRGASPHQLEEVLNTSCTACHTSCADCHISQPAAVGGGLIAGHNFNSLPSMVRNCTACHAGQVGAEYLGEHSSLAADVHYRQGGLECVACHSGEKLHGQPDNCTACHEGPESAQLPPPSHRFAGVQQPSCESCHASVATGQDDIMMHKLHGSKLSCQVCHSVDYASWDGSSITANASSGEPEFQPGEMGLTFLIGRNPIQTYARPYEFVTVRHAPISITSFDFFSENLLTQFSRVETWQYTTPHNIQRFTPQNRSCNYCHGNPDLFLTAEKVKPDELEANKNVIIEQIPPLITSAEQIPDVFGP